VKNLSDQSLQHRSRADQRSQRGLELLAAGEALSAAAAFREAIAADPEHVEAHHGLIRALRDGEQFEAAVGAALALTVLTPQDPLAHTSLSIALQKAGHIPEAETAAARARVLEWKQQLMAEPDQDGEGDSFA
jgi:Flp pilus assembly protein TadD